MTREKQNNWRQNFDDFGKNEITFRPKLKSLVQFLASLFFFFPPPAAFTLALRASRSRSCLAFLAEGPASTLLPGFSLGGLKDLFRFSSRLIADSAWNENQNGALEKQKLMLEAISRPFVMFLVIIS